MIKHKGDLNIKDNNMSECQTLPHKHKARINAFDGQKPGHSATEVSEH